MEDVWGWWVLGTYACCLRRRGHMGCMLLLGCVRSFWFVMYSVWFVVDV
jgi:hypothetical protein